jgi:hypothetical protein
MDPKERRWVVGGAVLTGVGIVAAILTAALWKAPKGLLESDPFMASVAVAVLGMALIVAAGARDALLSDKDTQILRLARMDPVDGAPPDDDAVRYDKATIRPVFLNAPDGDRYRTRYEVAMQPLDAVRSLLLEASAPTVIGIRFDDVRIQRQEAGGIAGKAWASVSEPPFLFRLDVITTSPERSIRLDGSVF